MRVTEMHSAHPLSHFGLLQKCIIRVPAQTQLATYQSQQVQLSCRYMPFKQCIYVHVTLMVLYTYYFMEIRVQLHR
jgi:hypothetical protein